MTSINCTSCSSVVEVENNDQRVTYCQTCNNFIDLNHFDSYTFNTIGEFKVIKKIAKGAMGTVYEAVQKNLERKVALKVLPPTSSSNHGEHVQRFLHEMKLAAQIEHPYVVSVHQAGEAQGFPYYSMNLVNGETLETLVQKNGSFVEADALRITLHIAEALESLWDEFKIIHRDIKPSNVMLSTKSIVQVLDMGLAKVMNENDDFTKTGIVLGSPLFLSPEQASENNIDFRSDIFSLGTTLYYILSGEVPFSGKSIPEILHNVINKPFNPIEKHIDNLSNETSILLSMMMSKKPEDRFESWTDLVDTLRYMLMDSSSPGSSLFDTCRTNIYTDHTTQFNRPKPSLEYCDTATAIIAESSDIGSGEYPAVDFSSVSLTNPTDKALLKFAAEQFDKIHKLTGIMDWVPMEKCPEVKKVLREFREGLDESVHVFKDFNLIEQISKNEVSLANDDIAGKYFTLRLKSELRDICKGHGVNIIYENALTNDTLITTDISLFIRMIKSISLYLLHGMKDGELQFKVAPKESTLEIEFIRVPGKTAPTYELEKYKEHTETLEGSYFLLASKITKLMSGTVSISTKKADSLKLSFESFL
ncbi:MAG: serine/threonine protein kinase [Lentisphaeraceae bacterium]|nr:serine/threonine protein kinase [Lentisphaeraceae bacterium]